MIDILNGGKTHVKPIDTVNGIPQASDLSTVTLDVKQLFVIYGKRATDYFGNEFQFKYDSSEILASSYGIDLTERYALDITAKTATLIDTIPHGGGVAAGDNFNILHGYAPPGSVNVNTRKAGTRFEWDGSKYVNKGTANLAMTPIDNYVVSSSGKILFDSYKVIRLNVSGTYDTLITTNKLLVGAVCSEDEKTIVTFDRISFAINRYEQQIDGTYKLTFSSTFAFTVAFPDNGNTAGMECAYNSTLSTVVFPMTAGAVVFKYDSATGKYTNVQTLPVGAGNLTSQTSLSMCRTGEFLATLGKNSSPYLYRVGSDGLYTKVYNFVKTGTTNKIKISPDGKLLGFDDVYWTTNKGAIYIHQLY